MSNGSTSALTEAVARGICEDWALTDKSFAQIARELRSEGHTVWPADISNWIKNKTQVTIDDETHILHDLLVGYRVAKELDMIQIMINIANTAEERMEPPAVTRNRINAYDKAIAHMQTRNLVSPVDQEFGFVVPYNPMFDEASKDAETN